MICPSCQSAAIGAVDLDPKSKAKYAHPIPHEGRIAIVTDAGWDAVDAAALLTNSAGCGRRSRVVLTPRRWR
jgi:hypothetical protein